jgi:apolipoprotein N-acyltransferase
MDQAIAGLFVDVSYSESVCPLSNRLRMFESLRMNSSLNNQLRTNLLCAGSSAIMLTFAHVHAELWFVALFALAPFLWRLPSLGRVQASLLGLMLATVYMMASSAGELSVSPVTFAYKLAGVNVIFALFGLAINRLSKRMGFNPLIIALVWFPLGFLLAELCGPTESLLVGQSGGELLIGFGSLMGILFWSVLIVLANGLIILLAHFIQRRLLRRSSVRRTEFRRAYTIDPVVLLSQRWAIIPGRRAPPILS